MQNVGQGSSLEKARVMWHRRQWLALLVFVPVLAAAVAVSRSLSNVYESTATVLVDHPQGPGLGGGTPDQEWARVSLQETWLRTLLQQILGRAHLAELITRFDLYPEARQRHADC